MLNRHVTRSITKLREALEPGASAERVRTPDGWRHLLRATHGYRHQYDDEIARGGWEFYELQPGLWLLPVNMQAHRELLRHHSFGNRLVLSAVLEGGVPINDPDGASGELSDGYCTMYGIEDGVDTVYAPGNPLKWVSIIVDRDRLTTATGLESDDLPASVRDFIAEGGALSFCNVPLTGTAALAVAQILDCRLSGNFRRAFLRAKTLELLCLVLLAFGAVPANGASPVVLAEHYLGKIRRARSLIEQSLDAPLNIPELAAAVGTTRQRLQLGFRQLYGGTVGHIRDKLRIEHALHLVRHSQIPMTDIAMEAGYEYLGSFTRAFRSAYGTSPTQMRRMAKSETFP